MNAGSVIYNTGQYDKLKTGRISKTTYCTDTATQHASVTIRTNQVTSKLPDDNTLKRQPRRLDARLVYKTTKVER